MDSEVVQTSSENHPEIGEEKKVNCVEKTFSFNRLVYLFFCINMLNYAERVVISGSSMKILEFIRKTIKGNEYTYYGALTSAFIVGFSIASIIFGYYVTKYPPFRVVSLGLVCWLCAAMGSGFSPNYWFLLFFRLISGVGEAAFQIVIPSYINDYSPKESLGSSMAWYYAAISVGTAIGFMGAGYISTYLSWRLSFIAVSPLVIPAIIILNYIHYNQKKEDQKSFIQTTVELIKSPVFIFAFLGEAYNVFVVAAYMAFGNQLLINLGLFDNEAASSLVFGGISVLAGVAGSMIGGYSLNRMKITDAYSTNHKLYRYSIHFGVCCTIAMGFFLVTAFTIHCRPVFYGALFLAFTFIFASNPTWTLVILNTASPSIRPMALGVATIFYHIFGDVPAPMIVGRVLDHYLSRAGEDKHKRYLSYLYTHWFSLSISVVMVICCALLVILAKRRYKKEQEQEPLLACFVCFSNTFNNKSKNSVIAPLWPFWPLLQQGHLSFVSFRL